MQVMPVDVSVLYLKSLFHYLDLVKCKEFMGSEELFDLKKKAQILRSILVYANI